ncbi:MAG: hypothetical protein OXR67_05165 [Chloroflexota bacterium]|nr:hypothetical protein [Chloroflexota bacterium]
MESAARFLPFSSDTAVVMGRSELVINSNPCMREQRSGSTAPPVGPGERDAGDAVLFPVAASFSQSVGQGIRLGWGYLVKRVMRFEECPSQTLSGEQGSIPLSRSGVGGRSESRARSYAAKPGSGDGTLQFSRQETLEKA